MSVLVIFDQVPLLVKLAGDPAELKKWQDALDENRVSPFPTHVTGLIVGKLLWLLDPESCFCAYPEEAIAAVCEIVTSLVEIATPHKHSIWYGIALGFWESHLPNMVNNIDNVVGFSSASSLAHSLYRVNHIDNYGEQVETARALWKRCLTVWPMSVPLAYEFAKLSKTPQYDLVTPAAPADVPSSETPAAPADVPSSETLAAPADVPSSETLAAPADVPSSETLELREWCCLM